MESIINLDEKKRNIDGSLKVFLRPGLRNRIYYVYVAQWHLQT